MPGTMRGVYTNLTDIRRRVFAEVAKLAYAKDDSVEEVAAKADNLPLRDPSRRVVPPTYRESVFLERAIISERIRLAMGLPLQDVDKPQKSPRASRRPPSRRPTTSRP